MHLAVKHSFHERGNVKRYCVDRDMGMMRTLAGLIMRNLKIGATQEHRFTPNKIHSVQLPGLPLVLSTPHLIWHLETAAMKLLEPYLDEGELSVGTHVDIEHLAPTPLGAPVVCTARVIHIDGPALSFQVEARDHVDIIGRGVHKRRVLHADRMAKGIERKAASL